VRAVAFVGESPGHSEPSRHFQRFDKIRQRPGDAKAGDRRAARSLSARAGTRSLWDREHGLNAFCSCDRVWRPTRFATSGRRGGAPTYIAHCRSLAASAQGSRFPCRCVDQRDSSRIAPVRRQATTNSVRQPGKRRRSAREKSRHRRQSCISPEDPNCTTESRRQTSGPDGSCICCFRHKPQANFKGGAIRQGVITLASAAMHLFCYRFNGFASGDPTTVLTNVFSNPRACSFHARSWRQAAEPCTDASQGVKVLHAQPVEVQVIDFK